MNQGQIRLIIGPMFSGKSSLLISRVKRHMIANEECLILKHSSDTRYQRLSFFVITLKSPFGGC
jgi:thymidine kinase